MIIEVEKKKQQQQHVIDVSVDNFRFNNLV